MKRRKKLRPSSKERGLLGSDTEPDTIKRVSINAEAVFITVVQGFPIFESDDEEAVQQSLRTNNNRGDRIDRGFNPSTSTSKFVRAKRHVEGGGEIDVFVKRNK